MSWLRRDDHDTKKSTLPLRERKKYKSCHGALTAKADSPWDNAKFRGAVDQHINEFKALNARREQQQGLGRPIIAAKVRDYQMVAVGNRVYFSSAWKTFHDFLRDHLFGLLGKGWVQTEQARLPEQRHKILQWYEQAITYTRQTGTKVGNVHRTTMTGAIRAFINLAYNVYLIAHHTNNNSDAIVKGYADRLKSQRTDTFAGVLFETYAAAAFLKAGFTLEFENEKDGQFSHVEFVAQYPKTGMRFSVEVKARDRIAAGEDADDVKRLRVANKLNKALGKEAAHTRVVMIEINVPEVVTSFKGWPAAAMEQIRYNEKTDFPDGEKKPAAYVFVMNHAFHNNLALPDAGLQLLATGFHIPDFGPDARLANYKEILETRARHQEMFALMKSMQTHYEIPATFDGEMPELAFPEASGLPRLQFGHWYLIPTSDGQHVPGRLFDATVNESKKEVTGCYQLATGENILAVCPISDDELAAYRHYPETFFGEIRTPTRQAKTLVELCDFFYESYKNTPHETLLKWLATAPDIEGLRMLSQEDLAIIICER